MVCEDIYEKISNFLYDAKETCKINFLHLENTALGVQVYRRTFVVNILCFTEAET